MLRHRKPPSQTWRTFLDNHVKSLVSVDFFTVPTIRFQVLYVFLVLAQDRRRILQFGVTADPTAEWTVQQLRPLQHDAAIAGAEDHRFYVWRELTRPEGVGDPGFHQLRLRL